MVSRTKVLLVIILSFYLSVTEMSFGQNSKQSYIVTASDYHEYWLWAGVRYKYEVENANTIYLHVGEITKIGRSQTVLVPQGGTQPSRHKQNLWLVFRVRTLDWPSHIYESIIEKYNKWKGASPNIIGIQIDFDAGTKNLFLYSSFLKTLRVELPDDCKISITGLMDWAANAEPKELNDLSADVNEVVFQTYRSTETIKNIEIYLNKMEQILIPFKLGLSEGANWRRGIPIENNPYFRGYIIFLRNNTH